MEDFMLFPSLAHLYLWLRTFHKYHPGNQLPCQPRRFCTTTCTI